MEKLHELFRKTKDGAEPFYKDLGKLNCAREQRCSLWV